MLSFQKIFGVFSALLFFASAVVQFNDPDALRWVFIYGVGGVFSLLFVFGKLKLSWAILLFCFYLGLSLYSWPDTFEGVTIGEGDIVNIERGREALGMLLAAALMLGFVIFLFRTAKTKTT
ncbi:MAG: transmembrane 220 family protein [Bacteroidota bacterium]